MIQQTLPPEIESRRHVLLDAPLSRGMTAVLV
jgi:hypothetical protein